MVKVSLIASSVRPKLYNAFLKSLKGTSVEHEVIFVGNLTPNDYREFETQYGLKYIRTSNIKPAQCYEIARRHAKGEVIVWVADDCEFKGGILTKAYNYWKLKKNNKLILSLQTKEADAHRGRMHLVPMKVHSFRGGDATTPLMAPLGLMSRQYLEDLAGLDVRFVAGQYENDIVMRAYMDGGSVEIFGDADVNIEIDHFNKHGGPRPFETGYKHDREILEGIWGARGEKSIVDFQPYVGKNLLTKSQSHKGQWE